MSGNPRMGRNRTGQFDPDQVRQFRREVRERLGEAQELGGILEEAGLNTADLDQMIRTMRALDQDRVYDDPEEVLRLQEAVVQGIKQLEFRIRRELGADDNEQVLLGGSQEVPEGFETLVEEYYRALSRARPGGGR